MNLYTSIPFLSKKTKTPQQIVSNSWSDREQVLHEDVNLFCWNRSIVPEVQSYLVAILDTSPEPIRLSLNQTNLHDQIHEARVNWRQYSKLDSQPFWEDISLLVNDFLHFSESTSGTMHLRIIKDNACAKFHTDGYPLRLITTYIGPGTEWLPERATNRKGLGKTNELIAKDPSLIQSMNAGHVGILKGELPNKGQSSKGIIHRSPEISHTGEKRLILRVDIN